MPRKLTNEDFLERANKIHNGKYSYPESYISRRSVMGIICPSHGLFRQKVN